MEKLTVSRIGSPKTVNYISKKTGKPDSFEKVGFQTNERGDVWLDLTYRGSVPVEIGKQYEFEITTRDYQGKQYFDAKLPRASTPSAGDLNRIETKIDLTRGDIASLGGQLTYIKGMLEKLTNQPELTSDGKPVPFEDDLNGVFGEPE